MSVAEIKEEIARLTDGERIELWQAIWDSIDAKDDIASPEWHREILAERAAEIESGRAKFLTMDELRTRLRD